MLPSACVSRVRAYANKKQACAHSDSVGRAACAGLTMVGATGAGDTVTVGVGAGLAIPALGAAVGAAAAVPALGLGLGGPAAKAGAVMANEHRTTPPAHAILIGCMITSLDLVV